MAIIDLLSSWTIEHSIQLMRYDAQVRREIGGMLSSLQAELSKLIVQIDLKGGRNKAANLARARDLMRDVDKALRQTYESIATHSHASLLGVGKAETASAARALGKSIGIDIAGVNLSVQQLEKLTNKNLILGAPAAEWWSRQRDSLKSRFVDQIRLGVLAGETNDEIVRRIRGRATGKKLAVANKSGKTVYVPEFAGGVMDVTTRNANALVRTSVQSIANAVRIETYTANEDLVDGVQILATLDNRTSMICRARSGMAWTLNGEPIEGTGAKGPFPGPPPYHYNCRSTLIPVLKPLSSIVKMPGLNSAEKRKLNKMIDDSTQSSMDGQVSGKLTYEGWLKTKPEAFQREVLGKGRWELWKAGKLTLQDMVDQSGNPITLEQLLSGVKGGDVEVFDPATRADRVWEKMVAWEQPYEHFESVNELQVLRGLQARTYEEWKKHRDTLTGDRLGKEYTDLLVKIDALSKVVLEQQKTEALQKRLLLALPEKLRSGPTIYGPIPPNMVDNVLEADSFVRTMVSNDRTPKVGIVIDRSQRAHFSNHAIYVNPKTSISTIIHEITHDLEYRYNWISERSKAFLLKRSKGLAPKPLYKIYPGFGYRRTEVAFEDEWIQRGSSAYAGKFYPYYATELLTMGMERMYAFPDAFAKEDPEYFKFVIDVLQGVKP